MAKTHKLGDSEDFKPTSEWKEEPENNIIILHLPDFTKEQVKITCIKSSRRLRVHGEQKLANNKLSRVNEVFSIPENCKIDKIHAKWHDGSLTVTLPKEFVTPIARKEPPKTAKGKEVTLVPEKSPQDPLPSKQGAAATSSSPMSDAGIDKKSSTLIPSFQGTPRIQGEKQTDGKRVVDAHALSAHQKDQKGSEESSQKLSPTSKTTTKQTDDHDKTVLQPKLGHLAEHKGKSEAKKETPSEKSQEKKGEPQEEAKKKKSVVAGASKAVMEQNKERQSMVNMGVAVLVIFALGAYISYSFSSKSKSSSS